MEGMDTTTILEILAVMVGILVVSQMAVLWFVLRIRRKTMTPDELLRDSRIKTENTIQRAIQQANKILVSAELKGIQLLSHEKVDSNELANQFQTHLQTIEKALEDQLEHSANYAESTYTGFARTAEKMINDHIAKNQKIVEDKSQEMIENTERLFTMLSQYVEAAIRSELEKELAKSKEEIAVYRQERMKVIDERIVDILEDVLRVTLQKKLSLADQSDLMYKALEEAKRGSAFSATTQKANG
ncbi:hypothetical protein A2Z00_05575 [Candidatus Gottesmanbacteria bacterium RBG_13_45_10]|uniref:Uncharacterized protein n=1 Tax=Candidatus Gottesmanbacteria bacterium RBG_13_45_10 TaxID=1798370 RepID=A0A1F5ZGE7_9BACT|nr:MAG: hypothetical protein A2Z00_05575 [Candidatus Gottesmanbacteria bacterium RBG_13_45_10]